MKQSGLAPILIILLAAVLGIGGYFGYTSSSLRGVLNPSKDDVAIYPSTNPLPTSSDETVSWKTYTNNKYGYTIRYPQTWQIQEDVPSPYDTNKPRYTFFFVEKQEFLPGLRVYVTAMTTPEQWIGRNIQFARSEKIIVADFQAVKLRGIPEGLENEYVFLDKNGQTIVFLASGDETLKVFDQILSTFRFTDNADARIMVDIKQIQTALELYFSDYKHYPSTLQELSPTYLTTMPHNLYDDSEYSYQSLNTDYKLTGTLGDGSKYTVTAPK